MYFLPSRIRRISGLLFSLLEQNEAAGETISRNAGELLRRYPTAHVTAVDYSELSVEKAKEYNQNMIAAGRCTVQQGDVSALELPELTKIFCINDECTYGDIPGLEFIRHTTLGTGGDRCDFYVRVQR